MARRMLRGLAEWPGQCLRLSTAWGGGVISSGTACTAHSFGCPGPYWKD